MELTDEEVLGMTIDDYLEYMDLELDDFIEGPDMTVGDFIQHYGVMGMHWGIRKSRSETGVSRSRGALLDRNKRQLHQIELASRGRKYRGTVALGRTFMGSEALNRRVKDNIKDIKAQNNRLTGKGKLTIEDRLDMFNEIALGDLFISVTPNRQAPRWQRDPYTGRGRGISAPN